MTNKSYILTTVT